MPSYSPVEILIRTCGPEISFYSKIEISQFVGMKYVFIQQLKFRNLWA